MDSVRTVARQWLVVADRMGWGVEGPTNAPAVRSEMQGLATGRRPRRHDTSTDTDRPFGVRPVDALSEAAELLTEAATSSGIERQELVSAARGWLAIAEGGYGSR